MTRFKVIIERYDSAYFAYPLGVGATISWMGETRALALETLDRAMRDYFGTLSAEDRDVIASEAGEVLDVELSEVTLDVSGARR